MCDLRYNLEYLSNLPLPYSFFCVPATLCHWSLDSNTMFLFQSQITYDTNIITTFDVKQKYSAEKHAIVRGHTIDKDIYQ